MELGSDTEEIPVGIVDSKKCQHLQIANKIDSEGQDVSNSFILLAATKKQIDRSQ